MTVLTGSQQARSFGVLVANEEAGVRELVSRTTERLKRASAGPDDMGSRYARLLELLWKLKVAPTATSPESLISKDLQLSSSLANMVPEPGQIHFSPANDFSWLDLGAVGDYVSGDQITAAGVLGFDGLQDESMYAPAGTQMFQAPFWTGDMSSLLF